MNFSLPVIIDFGYIAASILFIIGLKMLSKAESARKGNMVSAIGMLIAIVVTLIAGGLSFQWIIIGIITGSIIGVLAANLVKMTAIPEMVALFNGFGGAASLLIGWAEFHNNPGSPAFTMLAIILTVLIGAVTFSGSIIAWAKLSEVMDGKPVLFGGQQILNSLVVLVIFLGGVLFVIQPELPVSSYQVMIIVGVLSLLLGVLSVIPIGGADMPVVIALLNSYSGLAACAAGFVIMNNVLIVSGALVGASGIILTSIMCKAMNRSLANVLFSGFGATSSSGSSGVSGEANPVVPEDAYYILEAASSVVFVPGYGMAVAQAQHAVRELGELLEANGTDVKYAVHPVAGRMPGHMNVLLAESNVPYEQLVEMDDVNPTMESVDVCIVIGANDVVNPSAREDESSPIYGMPIINVDFAKTVIVSKRSLASGFAGVGNPLFFKENTRMLFGDAKQSIQSLVAQFKES